MSIDTNKIYSPIIGDAKDNHLFGTGRSEIFSGRGGEDVMLGNSGSDAMYGGGGNDLIHGQRGDDKLYGGGGPKIAKLSDFEVVESLTGTVTFLDEGAGFRNSLGVYKISENGDISDVGILFPNASKLGSGGDLVPGESAADIDLLAGERVGFFVVSNGFGRGSSNQELLSDAEAVFELRNLQGEAGNLNRDDVLTLWHTDSATGEASEIRSQYGNDLFHSTADPGDDYAPNPDNFLHTVGTVNTVSGEVMLGFEDLKGGGDRDYDDVVFRLDIGQANAVALVPPSVPSDPGSDDDILNGGRGNDEIYGMSGNDIASGGDGHDKLWGNSGNDILRGEAGNDELRGGKGDDEIHGGSGNDKLFGDSGDDLFIAGSGSDAYVGGKGVDTIDLSSAGRAVKVDLHKHTISGMGNDTIDGIEAAIGSRHADSFKGDKRDNAFYGGDGDDLFRGLGGDDLITGGAGDDTFTWRWKDIIHQSTGEHSIDTITDFELGDILDFGDLIDRGSFDHVDDVVRFNETDDGTMIAARLNGHSSSEFTDIAMLSDIHGMTAMDLHDDGYLIF